MASKPHEVQWHPDAEEALDRLIEFDARYADLGKAIDTLILTFWDRPERLASRMEHEGREVWCFKPQPQFPGMQSIVVVYWSHGGPFVGGLVMEQ